MSKVGNKNKDRILGMPHGTANSKLRKSIIFHLAGLCNMLDCYRCGKPITKIDEMSIEHKDAWQQTDNPVESFFDLNNIAFSHLSCNSAAAVKYHKKYSSDKERWAANQAKREYDPIKRRKHYLNTKHRGC